MKRRTLLKGLRRYAESRSIGVPYAAYTQGKRGIESHPMCTKAVYKKLKQQYA